MKNYIIILLLSLSNLLFSQNSLSIQIGGACRVMHSGLSNKLITDTDLVFPSDPIICNQEWCSCGPDMETRKEYDK